MLYFSQVFKNFKHLISVYQYHFLKTFVNKSASIPKNDYWATTSGTKVRTIVTLVAAEQGRY